MNPTTEEKQQQRTTAYIHNPLKNRFVDFPCLRTDLNAWVVKPAKRAKLSSELTFHENFPPEYSLPAPFWLQKKC